MILIVFDVDGTLTATGHCDAKCYEPAFEEVFGLTLPTTDWHYYSHSVDTCIVNEAAEERRGTGATPEEMDRFEAVFVRELQEEYRINPGLFAEVPGARDMFEHIKQTGGMAAALATGGMRGSALFKLQCAGIDFTSVPGAFANDARTRIDIMQLAIQRAGAEADRIVYVGDALWDVMACAALGIPLIGITHESPEERLRAAGVSVCLKGYEDLDAFFHAVQTATPPAYDPARNPLPRVLPPA